MCRRVNKEVCPKRLSRRNIRSHHQNQRGCCQKVKERCVKERWVKERWVKADSECIEQNIPFLFQCQKDRMY